MKYKKIIDRIASGGMTRADLLKLQKNAQEKLKQGDAEAQTVINAISTSKPLDDYVLFMGFCPGADLNKRLDIKWKEQGICEFGFFDSAQQLECFNSICKGDFVVLKKIQIFGKTMQLFGYGRVTGIAFDENERRYLQVDWAAQEQLIEVPLMGCNSTVNIKSIEKIHEEMPEEFYQWINGST